MTIEFGNERIISVATPAAEGRRLGGARRGHHPAPPPGAGDHPPRAPRRADQPRQPRAVPRAAAAGAAAPGARPGLRRALPRPRPLQERQRHARPPGRRRAAEAGERAAARAACARATWWRASAATSSPSSRPTCATPTSTEALAARIVETVSKPYEIDGQRIDISTSIGMTLAPRDGADADQLMKNADLALYRAKADGRQRLFLLRAGDERPHPGAPHAWRSTCARPSTTRSWSSYYQPIICLETQKVTGFEALMRWTHPKRGAVPPAEFIALAEEIGLICGARRMGAAAGLHAGGALVGAGQGGDQPLAAADQARSDRGGAAGAGRLRPAARAAGAGDHRIGAAAGQPEHARHAAPAAPARRAHRHGRFRHRLLLAQLSAQLPLRQDQDRPGVHRRHRPQRRVPRDRRDHRQARHSASAWRRWPRASRTSSS